MALCGLAVNCHSIAHFIGTVFGTLLAWLLLYNFDFNSIFLFHSLGSSIKSAPR